MLIKPKPVVGQDIDRSEYSVSFDEIREEIIQGIRIAKYAIWVSVPWFTDRVIYEELLSKKKEGIQIRIVTSMLYLYLDLNIMDIILCIINFVLWILNL